MRSVCVDWRRERQNGDNRIVDNAQTVSIPPALSKEQKFYRLKNNFLKYYKSPTPLFVPDSKVGRETNTDYVKECLRQSCHSNASPEHDTFSHFMDLFRKEYQPIIPVSPISSPVRMKQCTVQQQQHASNDDFQKPIEPVWHRMYYNKVEVIGALAPDTRSVPITRIKNPAYRSPRLKRARPQEIINTTHPKKSIRRSSGKNIQQLASSINLVQNNTPNDVIKYDGNKYDGNKYDGNKYDANKYDVNRYDVNKYDGNSNTASMAVPVDSKTVNLVTSSTSPTNIFDKYEFKQIQFNTQLSFQNQINNSTNAPLKLIIRKNKNNNLFEVMR